ncbi:MAG: hypothetical protein WBN42_14455 [Ignavibacteriaceae bacterium]
MSHSSDINNTMQTKFFNNLLFIPKKVFFLPIAFTLLSFECNCQTKTNLEIFYSLTDSLVDQINLEIPSNEKKILLTLNLGQSYSLFSNGITERFRQSGKEILDKPPDDLNIPHVDIVMEGAGVEYGEMFKDGWFGSHYVQRYSSIIGNYLQTFSEDGKREFEFTRLDTIKVEDIKNLENDSFPFTKGTIPAEPFISGLAEPLIAIGTAAVVVVLFFTIRSK